MRKKILFGIVATTMALTMMGCSKDADNGADKAEQTATAEAAQAKESEDKSDDSDKTEKKQEIEGPEVNKMEDGEGNKIDTSKKAETPSLDDYPKGAYVDADGSICIKENGETVMLWSPYTDIEKDIAEHRKEEQESERQSAVYTPETFTKDSERMVVLDDNGKVTETLDSTDKDFCDVYKLLAEYLENTCDSTDKEVMRKRLLRQKELSTDTVDFIDIDTFDYDAITADETLMSIHTAQIAFNKDKTGCRIFVQAMYATKDDEHGIDVWLNFTKSDGKWLKASEGDYPVLESYIVANPN